MKVNDIKEVEGHILVKTDRTFAVFRFTTEFTLACLYNHNDASCDNIVAITIASKHAGGEVVESLTMQVLLTHNILEQWELEKNGNKLVNNPDKMVRYYCKDEECLLYSGDILPAMKLVAAGTVFRSVLIWQTETGKVAHRLLGHTGVIFDVIFLSQNSVTELEHVQVASVSDDRSLRVYKGEEQICELYGHKARIWKVRELVGESESTDNQRILATTSEDATCRIWYVS